MTKVALLPACALMLALEGAAAQAPPSATTPPPPTALAASTTSDCAPSKPVPPRGTIAPEGTTTGQANEPLSERLAQSNGVMCPPEGVDPEIRAPTPDAGNTPVIPPPGSPGGNPNVQPK
jgi:hypothetical protein